MKENSNKVSISIFRTLLLLTIIFCVDELQIVNRDPDVKLCHTKKGEPTKPEIVEQLLFESALPLSSFFFLIETRKLKDSKVKAVIMEVIVPLAKAISNLKNVGGCEEQSESEENEDEKKSKDKIENKENKNDTQKDEKKKDNENKQDKNSFTNLATTENDFKEKLEVKENNQINGNPENKKYIITKEKDKINFIRHEETNNFNSFFDADDLDLNKSKLIDIKNLYFKKSKDKKPEEKTQSYLDDQAKVNAETTKSELLYLLDQFYNFSSSFDNKSNTIKNAIQARNSIFEKDKSQIAKLLFYNSMDNVKKNIIKFSNAELKKLLNVKDLYLKIDKYEKMIKVLKKVITESDNLSKAVERERIEFINLFGNKKKLLAAKFVDSKLIDLKISFNLGGSIFAPNIFLEMVRGLISDKKDDLIDKSISKILKPIESLELYVRYKTNTEKKEEIVKFLLACLEKRNNIFYDQIDDAFRARSSIFELYFTDDSENETVHKENVIDKYQENFTKNMLKTITNINEDLLEKFLVINKDLICAYKKFLKSGAKEEKTKLMKLF